MPEPAVFIVVAILAVVCAAIPFLYWHIKSRRARSYADSTPPTTTSTPTMRGLEAAVLRGPDKDPPGIRVPGAAGMVGVRSVPSDGAALPGMGRRTDSTSGLSGTTYVPSTSSPRPSTSTTRQYPSRPASAVLPPQASTSRPRRGVQQGLGRAGGVHPADVHRSRTAAGAGMGQRGELEAPPAYEEVVDEGGEILGGG